MPGWDENSPLLVANLTRVLESIQQAASKRERFSAEDARGWHRETMEGLDVPNEEWRGAFRGEAGLEGLGVRVGGRPGVESSLVTKALEKFEAVLEGLLGFLDEEIEVGAELTPAQIEAVIETCARVHAEWVRIHPFANGNGRTARLWANAIALRYGLPPFVRLRPRPQDGGYAEAAQAAMGGNAQPTVDCFREQLRLFLGE
ncbi:MAG: Fic family protein [Verrucomicrobiota bacterium]